MGTIRTPPSIEPERWYRALIDNAFEAILVVDADETILYTGGATQRILGSTDSEFLGHNGFEFLHPDELEQHKQRLGELLATPGHIVRAEYRMRHKDGSWRWLQASATNLLHNPILRAIVINFRDVTEQKVMQQQLERSQAQEREIVEAELERVRKELIRKTHLASLGEVTAIVAHELRNPLGAIRNAVFYLQRKEQVGEQTWRKYLDMIAQEVAASDRIISNLLEATRSPRLVCETFDLARLVREIFARLPPEVVWEFQGNPEPFLLCGDRLQIRQVLDNLVKNSLEALAGRGHLAIEARNLPERCAITVRDDGPGVPPEQQESVFEPLFSTRAKGTGLGLWVCRLIVEQHGGTIELLPAGRGAAFRILLPLGLSTGTSRVLE